MPSPLAETMPDRASRRRRRALPSRLALLVVPLLVAVTVHPAIAATNDTVASVFVTRSPFSPNGDGVRDTVALTVKLARTARLTVTVLDYGGHTVRTLLRDTSRPAGRHAWTWNGRDGSGRMLPHGPYRFRVRAVNGLGTVTRDLGIAKADHAPYLANPSAITIVINPGHGGGDTGASYGGYRESDMNLDIARRLEQMLRASRIGVVMLRATDAEVNAATVDVTGDGRATGRDELAIRNDLANQARGDVYVTLMNNAYGCHCARGTETYTNGDRTWTPQGLQLAKAIHSEHLAELRAFRSSSWYPIDRGVRLWDFYVMRPYEEGIITRPALMPSVLVESLFMDQPNELAVLARPRVRQALAVAYFDGIARYLNSRRYGVRYEPVSAPTSADVDGGPVRYEVALTNRGQARSQGWRLELRYVAAVPFYDGSSNRGTLMSSARIPDGLAPGASSRLALDAVPVPPTPGEWLVKADVRLGDGSYMSDHGVVALQLPLTTTTTSPSPSTSASPSPSPSTEPAPTASTAPAADPTVRSPASGPGMTEGDGDGSSSSVLAGARPPALTDALRTRGLVYVLQWRPATLGGPGRWEWRLDYDPGHRLGHHHRGDH